MPLAVTSVNGPVNVDTLGRVLTHEHLHLNVEFALQPVPNGVNYPKDNDTFRLESSGTLRKYPYSTAYNMKMDDEDTRKVMLDEVLQFKQAGGSTIVDNTPEGLSRDLDFLKSLSIKSGVNIIAGTGFYTGVTQKDPNLSIEAMFNVILKDLTEGNGNGVKCGIVGEVGCSWPIDEFEKRSIRATAEIQQYTGKPVTFHPGASQEAPFEIIRLFCEAGGKTDGVIMSHLDLKMDDDEKLLEYAKLGTFTQLDMFGSIMTYYGPPLPFDFISDKQRLDKMDVLKENGHLEQITVSQDIHSKHRMANFGGHGLSHFLQSIVPLLKARGWTEEEIEMVIVENSKRWLSHGAEEIK